MSDVNVAVAVRNLRAEGRFERALVLDLDVHQGNGTAKLFEDDPLTFTASMHGAKNFPRIKERSDLDVPLPDECEDAEYMARLDDTLASLRERFDPEVVFYVAGALVGAFGGALQAASRTLLVRQADETRMTAAFGLYALAGKATSFLAPLLIAWATWMSGSQQWGVAPVIALFLLGLATLVPVSPDGDLVAERSPA